MIDHCVYIIMNDYLLYNYILWLKLQYMYLYNEIGSSIHFHYTALAMSWVDMHGFIKLCHFTPYVTQRQYYIFLAISYYQQMVSD